MAAVPRSCSSGSPSGEESCSSADRFTEKNTQLRTGLLVAAAQVGRLPHWLEALVWERASASARWTALSEQCTAMFGATNEVIEGLVQPFTRVARIVALLNQCHGRLLEHVRPCLGITTTYIIADETLQQTKQQYHDKLL